MIAQPDSLSEHSASWWRSPRAGGVGDQLSRTPLLTDEAADVCIVGAGIAGLSVAYGVQQSGRSVIVLDDGDIGGGESGQTTAHLVTALDDRFYEIERLHGERGARLAAEAQVAALDHIEDLIERHHIECDFRRVDGYLWVPPEIGDGESMLMRELDAAHRAGLEAIMHQSSAPGILGVHSCLRFLNQAQFHPLRYLGGLARVIEERGGRIFTGSHARHIHGGPDAYVQTAGGERVRCQAIVVATNTPVNDRVALHTKQAAYRTYVVALRMPKGSVQPALYWDGLWGAHEWYHYVRIAPGDEHDALIVGGEDHKTGQGANANRRSQPDEYEQRFQRLVAWAQQHFPVAGEVVNRWSGQVMEPIDALGYIGRDPAHSREHDNVFTVTGDSGTGMTNGTIAGLLLPDLIAGRSHRWATLYDPSRIRLRAAGQFTRENANTAVQYADWVRAGDVKSPLDIEPGSGAIVRHGLRKMAVYRDESGELFTFSAMCPHLGGVVRWNASEHTWDCPCHGSRFDCRGRVLNGPALSDLQPITMGEKVVA